MKSNSLPRSNGRSVRFVPALLLASGLFVLCLSATAAAQNVDAPEPLFALYEHDRAVRLSEWMDWDDHVLEATSEYNPESETPVRQASFDEADIGCRSERRRFPVSSQTFAWHDTMRRRTVPLKIFYPSSSEDRAFPVIVFSHGLGGSYGRCSYLGTAWASRGFVAVLVQHPGSDEKVWKGKVRILNELREAYRYNWSGRTRAEDIRFVLDRMDRLVTEGDRIGRKLDPERIGVGGYDLGALAALLVAGQIPPDGGPSLYDPRVKAVLAMSPPINRPRKSYRDVYGAIDAPAFFVSGTDDDGIVGSTKAHQRRIPFDAMTENSRYLVVLQGADHQVYGGHFLAWRARNDGKFQRAIIRTSTCFWQAHLREDETAAKTLNGYGLNAMVGGLGRIERRLAEAEPLPEQTPEQALEQAQERNSASISKSVPENISNNVPDPMPTTETVDSTEGDLDRTTSVPAPEEHSVTKIEKKPFPLTRYYRSIALKYGDRTALED